MTCDLCGASDSAILRVNGWVVCQTCSSNHVMRNALTAKTHLEGLQKGLASADVDAARALTFKKEAEARVIMAIAELEAAINALVPIIAKSAKAADVAAKARQLLSEFAETEGKVLPHQRARREPDQD